MSRPSVARGGPARAVIGGMKNSAISPSEDASVYTTDRDGKGFDVDVSQSAIDRSPVRAVIGGKKHPVQIGSREDAASAHEKSTYKL